MWRMDKQTLILTGRMPTNYNLILQQHSRKKGWKLRNKKVKLKVEDLTLKYQQN